MQKFSLLLLLVSVFSFQLLASDELPGFTTGDPGIQSISALAFGSDGILFVGDSKSAAIVAIDTKDTQANATPEKLNFKNVDTYLASMLGTEVDGITIQDMAINPISKAIYFAVQLRDASPVLLKMQEDQFMLVDLKSVSHSKTTLSQAVAADAKDRRGRSLRRWAISDLSYHNGQVLVSGLSNEEFSSALTKLDFPFKKDALLSSIEIYHAAHGRYETYAPIKTFMPYELSGKTHIVASYTCTPLVIFPIDQMKPGAHLKGKTVAELGNRNTPLDIISYEQDGKPYLLMANTSRALMKIDPNKIEQYKDYLTEPVEESSATAGVDFINLPIVNVLQMDKYDNENIVLLQRNAAGELNLYATKSNRL